MKEIFQKEDSEYESPEIKIIAIEIENGFANSMGSADWNRNNPNKFKWN